MFAFFNDRYLPEEEVHVSVQDLALQRGYGLFDFFKTIRHKPVFLDDHLDRFYFSAQQLFLEVPYERNELMEKIYELVRRNQIADSGIRMTLTGGNSEDGYSIAKPNLIITQKPLVVPQALSEEAYILKTYSFLRPLPTVKSIDYLMAVWLQHQCLKAGIHDILYLHEGLVLECPRSNIFIVRKDGVILTPKQNVLLGITRNRLLSILSGVIPVEEKDITIAELKEASEVFITSTTKIVLPVSSIDQQNYTERKVSSMCFHLLCEAIKADIQ